MLFKHFKPQVVKYLESIGVIGLLIMLLFTGIHVISSNIFQKPLRGVNELTSFSQVIVVSCAMAANFFVGRHVSIEFLVDRLPYICRIVVNKSISFLLFMLFLVFAWRSVMYGNSLYGAGVISSAAHVPLYPFAYVIAIGAIISSLFFLIKLIETEDK